MFSPALAFCLLCLQPYFMPSALSEMHVAVPSPGRAPDQFLTQITLSYQASHSRWPNSHNQGDPSTWSSPTVLPFAVSTTSWGSCTPLGLFHLTLIYSNTVCVCSVAQSFPTLCDPMDWGPPGSSVPGILQARILEQVAIRYSRGHHPEIEPMSPASPILAGGFFLTAPPGKPAFFSVTLC